MKTFGRKPKRIRLITKETKRLSRPGGTRRPDHYACLNRPVRSAEALRFAHTDNPLPGEKP